MNTSLWLADHGFPIHTSGHLHDDLSRIILTNSPAPIDALAPALVT